MWTWSEDLQPGPINPTQFTMRVSNTNFQVIDCTAIGPSLFIHGVDIEAEAGPDVISYIPSTADVKDLAGNPAAAALNFHVS